jgi:hypothetical protein
MTYQHLVRNKVLIKNNMAFILIDEFLIRSGASIYIYMI